MPGVLGGVLASIVTASLVTASLVTASLAGGGAVATRPGQQRVPAPSVSSMASVPAMSSVAYAAPVRPPRVVHPFAPPSTPYGAGHLGVDLATEPGQRVDAAADGVVRFAGSVAGRGLVVLTHADGVTTEYEPLTVTVHTGQRVRGDDPIGTVTGTHRGCDPGRCLHWGARRDGDYLDPMSLLSDDRAGLGPARLLPWSVSP